MRKQSKLTEMKNLGEEEKGHFKILAYSKEDVLQGVLKLKVYIKEPNVLMILNYRPANANDVISNFKVTSDLNEKIVPHFLSYLKGNTKPILNNILGKFKALLIAPIISDSIDIESRQIKIPQNLGISIKNEDVVKHLPDEKWYGIQVELPDGIQKEFIDMLKKSKI